VPVRDIENLGIVSHLVDWPRKGVSIRLLLYSYNIRYIAYFIPIFIGAITSISQVEFGGRRPTFREVARTKITPDISNENHVQYGKE
jgi:hypothetical protein